MNGFLGKLSMRNSNKEVRHCEKERRSNLSCQLFCYKDCFVGLKKPSRNDDTLRRYIASFYDYLISKL
jgi:hypothetical protein